MSTATLPPDPVPTGNFTESEFEFDANFTGPFLVPISERAAYVSRVHLGVTSVLMFLCILAFGTRVYQRITPVWKAGVDDYFIVAGFGLTIADWAMLMPQMVPQPGFITLEQSTSAGKNSWLAISIWGLSMTCIKLSIAFTLLRIQGKERGWRIFLYTIMAVQVIYGIGNTLFNLVIACQPLEAAWNPFVPDARCVSVEVMRAVSNLGSSINITTDVLLSLAPATFLRKLNRPLRERIFVCVLMGMGLFASVSSIIKTVIVKDWGDPTSDEDFWAMGVSISTWTVLEQQLGLLAACVPAMKGIFQSCLGAMGVSLTVNKSQARSGYYKHGGTGAGVMSRTADPNATFRSHRADDFAADDFRGDRRYSRRGAKEMYDDETCIELPDISTNGSTKSLRDRSLENGRSDSRGHSVEQLPAHAV